MPKFLDMPTWYDSDENLVIPANFSSSDLDTQGEIPYITSNTSSTGRLGRTTGGTTGQYLYKNSSTSVSWSGLYYTLVRGTAFFTDSSSAYTTFYPQFYFSFASGNNINFSQSAIEITDLLKFLSSQPISATGTITAVMSHTSSTYTNYILCAMSGSYMRNNVTFYYFDPEGSSAYQPTNTIRAFTVSSLSFYSLVATSYALTAFPSIYSALG